MVFQLKFPVSNLKTRAAEPEKHHSGGTGTELALELLHDAVSAPTSNLIFGI
jgi:hypothetical protein